MTDPRCVRSNALISCRCDCYIIIGTPIVAPYTGTAVGKLYSVGACVDTGGVDASIAVCDYEPSGERTDARQPHEYRFRTCSPPPSPFSHLACPQGVVDLGAEADTEMTDRRRRSCSSVCWTSSTVSESGMRSWNSTRRKRCLKTLWKSLTTRGECDMASFGYVFLMSRSLEPRQRNCSRSTKLAKAQIISHM